MRGSRLRILLGVAMAGVVVGHSLAYFAALPNASARAELLARTGHSYWTGAVLLALAVSAVAFARHIRDHVRLHLTEGVTEDATGQNHLVVAVWLAVIQVSAYAVIEVTERLASGYPIQPMFHSALPLIGVAVQVLVACASTLLLRLLARAAEVLAGTLARSFAPSPSPRLWAPGGDPHAVAQRLLWAACRGRAPPLRPAASR
ncbi:MAG TPA: hypothetical protein VN986_00285 [Actinomycetota bacterium]|nr:hypothetical protein [Actinomycetota bacterium]